MSEMLQDYTDAVLTLQEFKLKHHAILQEYQFLQERVDDGGEALKAYAREHGAEQNELFQVLVQPKFRRWYDVDAILEAAPYVRDIPGVLVTSIDRDKIQALAKNGMLPDGVAETAYREEAMTAAVTIKRR